MKTVKSEMGKVKRKCGAVGGFSRFTFHLSHLTGVL